MAEAVHELAYWGNLGIEEVARLAVIAVVRTLLSWFLDKEVENTRRLQHPEAAA